MACGHDWLMRPLLPPYQMYKYESLKDGSIDLLDVAKMNEAIDVQIHNANLLRPKD